MYPQQPPKISTQGAFPSFQGQQIRRVVSQQGRSTAWARSQSHCPMRSCCCPGTSPWSVFLDCLSIFVVITFILTFQSHVSVFYCVSYPWCIHRISSGPTGLEETLHTSLIVFLRRVLICICFSKLMQYFTYWDFTWCSAFQANMQTMITFDWNFRL